MSLISPEKMILTRLFTAQRRLRFVRGVAQGLRWFVAGTGLASLGLVALWNWDSLPGPWQWLASAGRPRELLWLPLLLSLGGFASRWLSLPPLRETAYQVDRLRLSQERLLTAVDWILSEKPRTAVSERLLSWSANDLEDERRLRGDLRRLERVPLKAYAMLLSLLLPLALLFFLPPHVGLPESAAVWMGPNQVERLTEALAEEIAQTPALDKPAEKLKELMKALEQRETANPEAELKRQEQAQRELQRTVDQVKQMTKGQESARQLLETMAQRARQGQGLSPEDKAAFEELKRLISDPEQRQALDKAQSDWAEAQNGEAAESLESLQKEAGQAAQELKEMAGQGQAESDAKAAPQSGQEFDEGQGDQHSGQGKDGTDGKQPGQGQGQGKGEGQGQGQGEGPGTGPPDFGEGTTEQDEGGPGGTSGRQSNRQSDRRSEKLLEFEHLNAPVRNEIETSQTKVRGAVSDDGQRFRTEKEGLGAVTEPTRVQGGGALLEYQESAENALLREEVPADYRDEVRLYFEDLDK